MSCTATERAGQCITSANVQGVSRRWKAALIGLDRGSGRRTRPSRLCCKDSCTGNLRNRAILKTLIKYSAGGLCHLLRDEVAEALRRERGGEVSQLFTDHLTDWQEWLFPDLDDAEFADAYAQTITFGLLLARREGVIFEGT